MMEKMEEKVPEYIECIKKYNGSEGWWNVGDIYNLSSYNSEEKDYKGKSRITIKKTNGDTNGTSLELFKYFKPSTKEAFEAQDNKNNPITGKYYANKKTNNICRWGNNDSDYYLGGNIDKSDAQFIEGGGLFEKHQLREATLEEERWLEACIKANRFVPKEEIKKQEENWIPKIGEWVVFDVEIAKKERLNTSVWCKNLVLKVSGISLSLLKFENEEMMRAGTHPILGGGCSNSISCFRKALSHEIPLIPSCEITDKPMKQMKTLPTINWCIKSTKENKEIIKKWGKGIKQATDGTAKYYGFHWTGDYWYSSTSWGTELTTEEFCTVTGYFDIKKEEILPSKEATEFVLPEKWCVSSEENVQILIEYFSKINGRTVFGEKNAYFHFPEIDKGSVCTSDSIHSGYEEITFEQFQKYVLKNTLECSNFEPIRKESLLEEAKRRYPVGTKYVSANCSISRQIYTITHTSLFEDEDKMQMFAEKSIGVFGGGFVCYKGKWAEKTFITPFDTKEAEESKTPSYNKIRIKIQDEMPNIQVSKSASVTLKNTENEVKIVAKPVKTIKI